MDKYLISNALEYFDMNNEKYNGIFNGAKYITYIFSTEDTGYNYIVFYDKNKKELFRSRYEIVALYYKKNNIWVWGWSVVKADKTLTFTIRKLLNYGIDLDSNESFLKSELVTSRFRIGNEIQMDIHLSIASYLSKNPIIYKTVFQDQGIIHENQKIYKIIKDKDNDNSNGNGNYIYYYLYLFDYEQFDK
jgi:hypothetical protein